MNITIDPVATVFERGQEAKLATALKEVEKHTNVQPIGRAENIYLCSDAFVTMNGGYRYTTVALNQLCQLLAPGLSQLVTDLTGTNRTSAQPQGEFSLAQTADILNMLIARRISRVRERLFVRNTRDRTIDGIVGPKYRYLSNCAFHARVTEANGNNTKFFQALLYGRNIVLRYSMYNKLFVVNDGLRRTDNEIYCPGLHYANSEIGEACARAAPLLLRENSGDACLGPYTNRVKHQGMDFDAKLGKMLMAVQTTFESSDYYKRLIDRLMSQPLFPVQAEKEVERDKQRIIKMLVKHGLMQNQAKRAVASAVIHGAGYDPGDPENISLQHLVLSRRTAYDVFTALMREAKTLSIDARETVEQIAYGVLTGRILVGA